MNNTDQSISKEAIYIEDEDSEHSRWIHRDKLALIESHEMQEAGIKLPRPGRSNSKPKSSIEQGRDQYGNGAREHGQDTDNMGWGKSQGSQIPLSQQEVENGSGINGHEFDLRTLEEINAEPHYGKNSPLCRQPGLRSSSSRIPLPKSSPMPIPQEHIERNTPLPRKRGASGNWSGGDEDGIAYDKARRRSQSVGSQVLLDEGEMLNDVQGDTRKWNDNDSPSTSPSKRLASKTVQPLSFGIRKTSNALRNVSDVQKPRTSSNTYRSSPSNRPKSRSGLEPRPSAAMNRPEGDPPWLATMFKPDPRLPPDQQLLPTHAKRLQQEKKVVPGSTLEGGYEPVAVSYPDELPLPSLQPDSELKEKDPNHESAWPLKSLPNKESGSPGLGGTEHGGYSTIPKVQRTPSVGAIPSSKPLQQPKQEEKVAKKASCGCCVLM